MNKKVLGKGLNALLKQKDESKDKSFQNIPIEKIMVNPYQPRSDFDKNSLKELAESIKMHGLFQPITVRIKDGIYELIAGERRLRAAKLAGLSEIPVIIRQCSDEEMGTLALIENLQREDLNPLEEAKAYLKLIDDYKMRQEDVALKVGKSRSCITNCLRLLKLTKEVKEMVINKQLTMGQVKPLLTLSDDEQIKMAQMIINNHLSARNIEDIIKQKKQIKNDKKSHKTSKQDIY